MSSGFRLGLLDFEAYSYGFGVGLVWVRAWGLGTRGNSSGWACVGLRLG